VIKTTIASVVRRVRESAIVSTGHVEHVQVKVIVTGEDPIRHEQVVRRLREVVEELDQK
jgi:hypothetical protein